MESAASIIRVARQRLGWTQEQLARAAHTSRSAIARYETGRHEPTYVVLVRILHSMGASMQVVSDQEEGRKIAEVCQVAEAIIRSRGFPYPTAQPKWPVFKELMAKHG
ncbi:MAG: helix-turn-helix transcriptional regulator [Actinobacteria bacterium]|nr:helix-turn-helix transcriptional regulator [Actinomycetota bacterium]